MMISHIVAAAQNHTIGAEGTLPWDIPEDMKFFKEQTKDHIVVMGRKTYESMGRPLPKRLNIIVTRNTDYQAEGCTIVQSVPEALAIAKQEAAQWGNEIYIIGGEEIFRQTMGDIDTIFLTRIHQDIDGDTIYPEVDLEKFSEVARDARVESVPFTFVTYKKKS